MAALNTHYGELKASYLFRTIDAKVAAWQEAHPGQRLLRLGIGDVTQPLAPAVIDALHRAVADQAAPSTFHGYMPEVGAAFLREAIANHYAERNTAVDVDEIFVSNGASDDLGDVLDIFARGITVALVEPAYPAYLDANIMAGNRIVQVEASPEEDFAPFPPEDLVVDVAYVCSPNNPTGAVFSAEKLAAWVAWANRVGAVIIFDAAYEAFIRDAEVPRSIYEVPGAKECAIEICSLSKTAGFTGTRCGWTVVPKALVREGMGLNAMWVRNRTTKTNGISYILQRGAAAVFTPEGQAQTARAIEIYRENAAVLMAALGACGIAYTGGRNAPYVWMEVPEEVAGRARAAGESPSWALFDELLDACGVVGTPGVGFGLAGEGRFRLTAFGNPEDTREAARRLMERFGR